MKIEELRDKAKSRIEYYKKEVSKENKKGKSTNYHMYLEKIGLYKDFLIILDSHKGDKTDKNLEILAEQLDFIDNLKML